MVAEARGDDDDDDDGGGCRDGLGAPRELLLEAWGG